MNYFPKVEDSINVSIKISKSLDNNVKVEENKDENLPSDNFRPGYPNGVILSLITGCKIDKNQKFTDLSLQSLI